MNKLIKLLFLLLIFNTYCLSLDLTKKIVPIHKEIDILQPFDGNIEELINKPDKFTTMKFFRRHLIKKYNNNNLWLRLELEHTKKHSIQRQFVTKWNRSSIDLFLVNNKKVVFKEVLKKGEYIKYSSPLTLKPNEKYYMYLHIKTGKIADELYYFYFVSPNEMIDLILKKTKFFNHGIFFGIILTMMMYSFFMFFSIKEKAYLYLGFYQLSVLVYTSDIKSYIFYLLQDYPLFSYYLLKIAWSFIMMFLSICFAREFLNTKKTMPRVDKALNVVIVLLAIGNLNDNTVEFGSSLLLIFIIIGIYSFLKGNFSALFYVFGFSCFGFVMFFSNLSKLLNTDIYFEFHSILQVSNSIESFSLAFALYLKVRSIVNEKEKAQKEAREKEKMMLIQSRFASMGEMIASIAHQWRQPLNHLTMVLANLQLAKETNKLTNSYLDKKVKEANIQLKYMSSTIEDFTNFFKKKRTLESFSLEEICKHSLELVDSRCKKYAIKVYLQRDNFKMYANYKNELIQVIMIVLNNAIDALMLNNIENRVIEIKIQENKIIINDNAGGIPDDIILKIFDPYFSTKDKKFGTGLGLYTAKIIVDSLLKGKIIARNTHDGASFIIEI